MNAPVAGQALTSIVMEKVKTPALKIKFCNNTKPFYYDNSPDIPRYSVTCVVEPEKHKDFIKIFTTIENNEKIKQSVLKTEVSKKDGVSVNTGNWIIKFTDKKPIRVVVRDGEKLVPFDECEEVAYGQDVSVEFDILRYTKRGTTESGLSLKPILITIIKNPTPANSTPMNVATKSKQILDEEDLF